jgi:hypothetical protein
VTANQFFVPLIAEDAVRIVLEGAEHRHLAGAFLIVHFWNG